MARTKAFASATGVAALAAAALVGVAPSASSAAPAPAPLNPVTARQPNGSAVAPALTKSTPNAIAGSTKLARTNLWAVGFGSDAVNNTVPISLHGNGTSWQQVRTPAPANSIRDFLFAVSGTAANDVWAVGAWSPDATNYYPTSVHWDGSAWHVVKMPYSTKNNFNSLYGVVAFAPNDVWAAGLQQSSDASERTALIEHWNGTKWSIVNSPSVEGAPYVSLTSMAGTSSTDLWVAGWQQTAAGKLSPLTEHWNGTRWTIVSAPRAPQRSNSEFFALTAIAPNNVWAAGFAPGSTPTDVTTLIEHWDGTKWSVVKSPNTSNPTNELFALTATGPNDVWATGNSATGDQFPTASTITEHWNGSKWTLVASPNSKNGSSYVGSAVSVSPTNVWALGDASDDVIGLAPFLLQWNGTAWRERGIN